MKFITLTIGFLFLFSFAKSQIFIDTNGLVRVGPEADPYASLNVSPQYSTPGNTNLIIGKWWSDYGLLTMGVHHDYAWIQSWHGKPLNISRIGWDVIIGAESWDDVGIGYGMTNPSAKLHVLGNIYATGTITSSDIRLKKNIDKLKLTKELNEKINKLESITYDWDNKAWEAKKDSLSKIDKQFIEKKQYGFSAQEVQKIFPELVYEDNTGMLGISYQGFIPILFAMIKDQQSKIDNLQGIINIMQEECCSGSSSSKSALIEEQEITISGESKIFQNTPNPFSQNTQIKYFIAKNVIKATIYIYDMNGKQLKSIDLHQTGEGNIQINGGEFNAGMYFYSLIAEGQIIDTKRMVLTD